MIFSACRTQMENRVKEREPTFRDKVENKYAEADARLKSEYETIEAMLRKERDAQASSLDKFQHAKNHAIRLKLEQIEDLLVQIKSLL